MSLNQIQTVKQFKPDSDHLNQFKFIADFLKKFIPQPDSLNKVKPDSDSLNLSPVWITVWQFKPI